MLQASEVLTDPKERERVRLSAGLTKKQLRDQWVFFY